MGVSVLDLEPELADRVIDSCRAREPSAAAILVYGSYATGRASDESDLDLAVFRGTLRLARERNPMVDRQPEIGRYLIDGTLERLLN